jgi:hypothetical protein
MVPDISETGGTCTLEMLGTGETASVTGNAGNGVTYCGLMTLQPAASDPSQWRFRVSYTSDTTDAESAESTLEAAE